MQRLLSGLVADTSSWGAHSFLALIAGDLNLHDVERPPVQVGQTGEVRTTLGRDSPWWLRPLHDMTEIAQSGPTYVQKMVRSDGSYFTTTSIIDRCFVSLPPAVLVQLRVTGMAMPRTEALAEISDHVLVSFRICERKKQPRAETPWPRRIFLSKDYSLCMKAHLPDILETVQHSRQMVTHETADDSGSRGTFFMTRLRQ